MLAIVRSLFSRIVDYAGLFPPSELGMAEVVRTYLEVGADERRWLLGKLIVPVARLDDVMETFAPVQREFPTASWDLSVVLKTGTDAEISQALRWRVEGPESLKITSLELPSLSAGEIRLRHVPIDLDVFFEVDLAANNEKEIAAIARRGACAKMRAGGLHADAFPPAEQVARFLLDCRAAGVPFKATAGLHHPMRGCWPLGTTSDSDTAEMHGFLNLAVAAAFVHVGQADQATVVKILGEPSPDGFQFDAETLSWGERSLSLGSVDEVRRVFFRSFGSCSFSEPFRGLQEVNLV